MNLAPDHRFHERVLRDNEAQGRDMVLAQSIGLAPQGWSEADHPLTDVDFHEIIAKALFLAGEPPCPARCTELAIAATSMGFPVTRRTALLFALEVYRQRPFQVLDATLEQLRAALDTGKVSSEQLVTLYLRRIEAFDRRGPALRAMITVNPNAVAEACALDDERKQRGARGLFHGIPVILKDNYSTKDLPTTCGIPALRGFYPADDAHVVKQLLAAGAIVVGKANLHELALFGTTYSTLGGQTRNPYDLTKTPGGSSGGTGAGVSANYAAVGLGTDAVNSVRSPASANNLVGIRPTKGLVNLDGIIPVSCTQDNAGPIARTVADAACLLGLMTTGAEVYQDALISGVQGLRIGVLRCLCGGEPIHAEVNRVVEAALDLYRGLGVGLVDDVLPEINSDTLLNELDVQRFEVASELDRYLSDYGAPVKSLSELAAQPTNADATREFLTSVSLLEDALHHPEYHRRLARIRKLRQRVLDVMDEYRLDALFYPHQKRLVVDIGEPNQADRNGILSALTGCPSITFQGGFSTPTQTARIGVPVGIELMARPNAERTLIALAAAFERASNHRRIPPTTPALP